MAGYGSDDALTAWMNANGYSMPAGAPSPAVLRQRGSAYLDATYGACFPGSPTAGYAQERAWPRTGATAHGAEIPADAIPSQIEAASYHAAHFEAQNPGVLAAAVTPGQRVKREKVASIETEYFDSGSDALASVTPLLAAVEGLLKPFMISPEGGAIFVV